MRSWTSSRSAKDADATRRPGCRARGQRGFTLLELMVASGYFLIGITGVMLYQVAAAKNSASAGDLMMATTLTANQLETLRNMPTAQLTTLGPQTYYYNRNGVAAPAPGWFQVSYTFVAPLGTVSYTALTVTTNWTQSPINPFQHGVTMSTYVGSN